MPNEVADRFEKISLKKKAPNDPSRAFFMQLMVISYLQQSALVQVVFAHFCPLGQLVQVACLAFAFLTGALTFAITEVAANAIASMLNIIFFIFLSFKS